jgi:membrane protein YqaA with SNARE-associated domain
MPLLAICFSALSGSFISAFIPAVNAELLLLGLAAAAPPSWLLVVVALTTTGQMCGKVLLYLAGRGVIMVPAGRGAAWLERAKARADRHRRLGGTFLFASALSGLPPFYLTSITAGLARFSFRGFLVFGSLGRFLRFAAVALVPLAIKALL